MEGGPRETILVVDDDRNICAALQRQLARTGYLVHCVYDGASALDFARSQRADLVILDLFMPGMNGIETCRALRTRTGWAEIPVLILTGAEDEGLYEQAIHCGADDFLTKPVRSEELLLRVKSLIRMRGLFADLRVGAAAVQAQNDLIVKSRETRERLQAFLLHDLKNPIASILLQAEMMIDLEAQPPEAWKRVLTGAEHLMKLVASWMDHIRAEQTGIQPAITQVKVLPFLEAIRARHELWFKARGVLGIVEVADSGLSHPMDPVLMERVVGNLLDNSLRYSPDGGRLRLEASVKEDGALLLTVSDQGPGVPPGLRERMFDLYAQLETVAIQGRNRETRGLGLAFCKTAVESHGGRIWVEDNPGGGCLFTIELPGA